MPSVIKIRRGLDIKLPGAPVLSISDGPALTSVALLGADLAGVRPAMRVNVGDRVRLGETLFSDRRRPQICWTAPGAGVIKEIRLGPRRTLDRLLIELEGDDCLQFESGSVNTDAAARQLLLASGLWVAFHSRPFGRIPDPDAVPAAIFVNAMDSQPLAADPALLVGERISAFVAGLDLLKLLSPGLVYVCQAQSQPLVADDQQLRTVVFQGPHPAGLPGTHIHHLLPVSTTRSVWQIAAQEVIAIGQLLLSGRAWVERVISVAGPGMRQPRLLRTRLGASIDELLRDQIGQGNTQAVSGSVLAGRNSSHLGRYHYQISVLGAPAALPGSWWKRLTKGLPPGPSGQLIPLEAFEALMPLNLLPVPLLRALSVGDSETATAMGCLELLEEDLALLSYVCSSRTDYGALLRQALDDIAEDRR